MDDNLRIWRNFEIGDLMDLTMLDTRQYDRSITDLYWNTDYVHAISNDAGRTLLDRARRTGFTTSFPNRPSVVQHGALSGTKSSFRASTSRPPMEI
jgi:hypothetical protein